MSIHRSSPLDEHPDVAPIERVLTAAASRSTRSFDTRGGRIVAGRAVWFCPCIYDEDCLDTPTWLVYDTPDGAMGWQRIPDGRTGSDLVDAELMTGDHVEPAQVRCWLEGRDEHMWPGADHADREIIADLGRRVRELAA